MSVTRLTDFDALADFSQLGGLRETPLPGFFLMQRANDARLRLRLRRQLSSDSSERLRKIGVRRGRVLELRREA